MNKEIELVGTEQLDQGLAKQTPAIIPTPNPSLPHFKRLFREDIVQLVTSSNIHKHSATCYKYSKIRDNPTCRMRMPRQLVEQSSINVDSGEIKLKRLHATVNNFNEYIISACRSNMDIKFIYPGNEDYSSIAGHIFSRSQSSQIYGEISEARSSLLQYASVSTRTLKYAGSFLPDGLA